MTPTQTLQHTEARNRARAETLDGMASQMREPLRTLLNDMAFECRRDAELAASAVRSEEVCPIPDRRQRGFGLRLLVGGRG